MADPNHVLVPQSNVLFVLPHKSACTSMKTAIRDAWGIPSSGGSIHDDLPSPLRYCALADRPRDVMVIGVIRDPFRRFASSCRYIPHKHPVDAFVEWAVTTSDDKMMADVKGPSRWIHLRSQAYDYYDGDTLVPTVWLYVESLQEDWSAVLRHFNLPAKDMPHLNRSGDKKALGTEGHEALRPYHQRLRQRFLRDWELYEQNQSRRAAVVWRED